ncbi:WGxxGxxG family protein [Paenibacillus sp. GCM10027629]|uniref:WGxxGxxG family protein n=1 Tax=Paenibacillus sp. GCM10027629 TaxID=3273414 RepID=UPI003631180C
MKKLVLLILICVGLVTPLYVSAYGSNTTNNMGTNGYKNTTPMNMNNTNSNMNMNDNTNPNMNMNSYRTNATGDNNMDWGWLGLLGLVGLAGLMRRNPERT